ncbi:MULTISPECIES: CPBP family intramembrane glutamic endopeptidase [Kribbella]|uniref:Membrane protease YdiL (CAAX protease family) n=1 Tax=Kribbella pratensis TaxID=2512112 RepID=A0ABY2F6B0_9ACTN|nr:MULTISPECIES: type II CAAX endopeptidase family protein [Kribbella]TDW83912.1 membrane protease YdiL (CAAX protease family) [Kribbella pratensis]TDW92448.1 membrane protease YdiL (CAAX protease family) [Kribbella sp. VKM Ac-2566]
MTSPADNPPPPVAEAVDSGVSRSVLSREVWLVLALSLGASGVAAIISFTGVLTSAKPISGQTAVIVGSRAPGRPWLDLAWQIFAVVTALVPVALVGHLLARGRESFRTIGFDLQDRMRDLGRGTAIAAAVGGAGLLFYIGAHATGVNLTVDPSQLPDHWWRIPILIAVSVQNAVLEEVIVLGYLNHRLDQLGWSVRRATVTSSLLRGSYHLYQGLGGFAGNVVMGVIFTYLYRRWGRIMPLVVAHTLIDTAALIGATYLLGKVSWLPS